jgi:PKD repeat protein
VSEARFRTVGGPAGSSGPLRRPPGTLVLLLGVAVLVSIPGFTFGGRIVHGPMGSPSSLASGTRPPVPPSLGPLARPAGSPPARWINVSGSPGAPPGAYYGSLAFDPMGPEYVYFGGCGLVLCPLNVTWVFSDGRWSNVTNPADSPPSRFAASMDFDANAGGLLLFGGYNGNFDWLNDTWLFHDNVWTNESYLGPAPPGRDEAAMAFDPGAPLNGSVLFGGCAFLGCYNDTWVWHPGGGWSNVSSVGPAPSPRGAPAMVYDPAASALLLFGGVAAGPCGECDTNDTWEWYGGSWWVIATPSAPPGTDSSAMAYDGSLGAVILSDGWNSSLGAAENDTWSFAAGAWTNLSEPERPSGRWGASIASGGDGTAPPLLFSGLETSGNSPNDTWAFEVPPSLALASGTPSAEVSAPATVDATVSGGSAPYSIAIAFGDTTTGASSGDGPTLTFAHAYLAPGNYTVRATVTDAVGATATNSFVLAVHAGPEVQISASPAATDVGLPVTFAAETQSASSGAWSYLWNFGDTTSSSLAAPDHTFGAVGTYPVNLTATDGDGGIARSALPITVSPFPVLNASVLTMSPAATRPTSFAATVLGGTGPFEYSWSLGDGSTSHFSTPMHTYAAVGTYAVTVWLNDSAGASVEKHLSVAVTAPSSLAPIAPTPSNGSTTAGAPLWFWGGLGVIGVVAVIGVVVRLRRQPPAGPAPNPP